MLDDIRTGRAEVVIAWHTDRLLRDMGDLETYITACRITDTGDGVPTYTVRSGRIDQSTLRAGCWRGSSPPCSSRRLST